MPPAASCPLARVVLIGLSESNVRAYLMVFQLDNVNQYLTICFDDRLFLFLVPLNSKIS
jgi:hypothetical protein